jgi:hypothetical protein
MLGKAIGAVFVAAIVMGVALPMMPKNMQRVVNGPPTHDDRCSELISQKLPGSFVVLHTDPERFPEGERNAYRVNTYGVNHGGNVDFWCWTGPKEQVELQQPDGPPPWSNNILVHDRNGRPMLVKRAAAAD